jgi:myo-inositol catabolism protein IolS
MLATRTLGKAGFDVTEIGFGAWAIGGGPRHYGHVPEEDAHACLRTYLNLGGNFIDTARRYGVSERIIGDFFAHEGVREQVVIASKSRALELDDLRAEVEESLRLLRTDYVDIYFMHMPPDDPDQMNRTFDAYEQLKQEGKIRAIGASIKGPDVTQHTVDLCRQYIRSGRVDVLMVIYSIQRQLIGEMLEEAQEAGVGVVARTVLESGFLAGKYVPGHQFTGKDHRTRWTQERVDTILQDVQHLNEIAVSSPYETLSQVAIRFALDRAEIASVVLGGKTPAEVEQNMQVVSTPALSQNLRSKLVDMYQSRTTEFNTDA